MRTHSKGDCSYHPLIHIITDFFFNDTATTEIYTLSLHDALPICRIPAFNPSAPAERPLMAQFMSAQGPLAREVRHQRRSEEHTSELQSHVNLVCRLLLEKKKKKKEKIHVA